MNIARWARYYARSRIRNYRIKKLGLLNYADSVKKYSNKKVLSSAEANSVIATMIDSRSPFLVARFGATELLNVRNSDFPIRGEKGTIRYFSQLCNWSGFFPEDLNLLDGFISLIKSSLQEIDVFAIWFQTFEDYYIESLMDKDVRCTYLLNLEPWRSPDAPWSAALKGKKVLVIHPFSETIQAQYQKREKIFPGTDILPEFDLKTLKAVQTLAGNKDDRFGTWFEALEWMYQEAMKIDFDVAIIGCGAYGMPLAAKIKSAGKQAIHLAGATQLLFGIRGKRWDTDPAFEYVRKWYNDAWVYPGQQDRIQNGNTVEGACYW